MWLRLDLCWRAPPTSSRNRPPRPLAHSQPVPAKLTEPVPRGRPTRCHLPTELAAYRACSGASYLRQVALLIRRAEAAADVPEVGSGGSSTSHLQPDLIARQPQPAPGPVLRGAGISATCDPDASRRLLSELGHKGARSTLRHLRSAGVSDRWRGARLPGLGSASSAGSCVPPFPGRRHCRNLADSSPHAIGQELAQQPVRLSVEVFGNLRVSGLQELAE